MANNFSNPTDLQIFLTVIQTLSKKLDIMMTKIDSMASKTYGKAPEQSSYTKSSDRLISVAEASRLLCRSEYCIREDIRRSLLPAKKHGKSYKLSFNQIQQIISEQC